MKIVVLFLTVATLLQAKSFSKKISGRIIGGQPAYAGEFPFAAAIYITTANGRYFCSGSLIGPQWILTAAQCANGALSFNIHLGSNILEGQDDNRVIVATSEFVIHPEFNPLTLENDIALIKLRMPVTYTTYVQRVFMAYGNLSDYTDLRAIGWGQTSDSNSSLSNVLNFVNVAAVPNLECQSIYGPQINDNMVCVAGEYNEGACEGDSGSALVHFDFASKSIRHVGIASFLSANGCESTDPSGYTRTYSYKEWITNVTGIIS